VGRTPHVNFALQWALYVQKQRSLRLFFHPKLKWMFRNTIGLYTQWRSKKEVAKPGNVVAEWAYW